MFQNAAIDIAIGLILMYLVLSLLCTVVNEFIATKLKLRSKNLAAGLQELLDDPVVRNAFYDHGLIAGTKKALATSGKVLTRRLPGATTVATAAPAAAATVAAAPVIAPARTPSGGASSPAVVKGPADSTPSVVPAPAAAPVAETQPGDHPSYLSADTFALALVGALTGTRLAQGQATPGFAEVQSAIEALPPSKIKSALQASLMSAEGDSNAFRKSVMTWFDDSMERLSGAYKRHLKLISILIGCAVAVIMNADTFAAGYALWSDSALRAQMVQVADATVKSGAPAATPAQTLADVANAYKKADETLRPLPIGWPMRNWPGPSSAAAWMWFFIAKFAGWFVTGLALSLGAPFWFDLLSKFVNIRGAGVKPDRQDAKK